MVKINNLSNKLERYVVARRIDGEYWYWGTYTEMESATVAAKFIDGEVFESKDVLAV